MTQKEQTRLQVLNSFLTEHITLDQAAELMGVSPRHTRRMLAAYQESGAAALAHGHRGRKPANAIPEATRRRVVHLARTRYSGANHSHLSEKAKLERARCWVGFLRRWCRQKWRTKAIICMGRAR